MLNVSSQEPYFKLSKLAPGNSVQVKVYAANVKGRSQPFELEGSTLKAEKHTGNVPRNSYTWMFYKPHPFPFFFCPSPLLLFFSGSFLSPISTPSSYFFYFLLRYFCSFLVGWKIYLRFSVFPFDSLSVYVVVAAKPYVLFFFLRSLFTYIYIYSSLIGFILL